jgi:lysozyme
LGAGSLKKSSLLKKVNADPNNLLIAKEFAKYKYNKGKISQGLINRRQAESELYFS